jgi:hypothetical protein
MDPATNGETHTTDDPPAKKQCTEAAKEQSRPAPKFKAGDIVRKKNSKFIKNGAKVEVLFQIEEVSWWQGKGHIREQFKCQTTLPLASGAMMPIAFGESMLEKIELTIGQLYVVNQGDGTTKEAVLDHYYLDGPEVKCEMSYNLKETVDYTKLKPVSEDSAGATGAA